MLILSSRLLRSSHKSQLSHLPPPPRHGIAAAFAVHLLVLAWLLTMLVAQPAARHDDSIPSDREEDGVLDAGFGQAERRQAETFLADPVLIMDSGASHHSTGDRRLLSEFVAALQEDLAAVHRTRDGRELPAAGAGTVATEKFQLSGVLYVPGLVSGTVLVPFSSSRGRVTSSCSVPAGASSWTEAAASSSGRAACKRTTACTASSSFNIPLDAAAAADGADNKVA